MLSSSLCSESEAEHRTEKFWGVELTFATSLTGLLSYLGSNIYKTQDQSHSDTTPLFTGRVKNFKVKRRVYKRVIYYIPSRWKKLYLIFFSPKFLVLNFFLKFLTKISLKKLLNILFSI